MPKDDTDIDKNDDNSKPGMVGECYALLGCGNHNPVKDILCILYQLVFDYEFNKSWMSTEKIVAVKKFTTSGDCCRKRSSLMAKLEFLSTVQLRKSNLKITNGEDCCHKRSSLMAKL